MQKNRTLLVRRLYFIVIFSLFGALGLYAEGDPSASEPNSGDGQSVSTKEFEGKITDLEKDISELKIYIKTMVESSLDTINKSISKPQIWQIIIAVSAAFIAFLLLGVIILALLRKSIFSAAVDVPTKPADEKPVKEDQPLEKSSNVSPGISSSEFNTLKNKLEDQRYLIDELRKKVMSQSEDALRFRGDFTSFQTEMAGFKQAIKSTNDAVSSLKTDIDKNREKFAMKEQVERDPVVVFNQWAQNPHSPIPQYFTYIANVKLEFRTKQDFVDNGSNNPTDWIKNTIGEKKYLFPNPNKIDNLSGPIDKLYKVTGMRKAKGTNCVEIISPCQIKEGNFIEYQGELRLM
jgi:uncharacterized protein YukE